LTGRVPAFERNQGFLLQDGALLERTGAEAVKQWLHLMLRQQLQKIPIYRVDGRNQIGLDYTLLTRSNVPEGYQYAELERQVRETCSFCPAIVSLDSFQFIRFPRGLQIAFTVRLQEGDAITIREMIA